MGTILKAVIMTLLLLLAALGVIFLVLIVKTLRDDRELAKRNNNQLSE